ncbi:hypothetical protein QN007_003400 [Escherichia coli]|nr:asparagine synthase-related protein [Escherichia coli]EFF1407412.1 hypothetical protein [Escherichia coli]ELV1577767.1 hypothetical protein [Escherichia coli]MCO4971595.1 asparagine synthase C-terminal domain-containing protein [Escherichia coli]MSG97083.1 hypothetical protein [Escherichia coli]MSH35055.1 hypothetical protein [Escherichia coli]
MINFIVLNGKSESVKKLYETAQQALKRNLTFKPVEVANKISGSGAWAYTACGNAEGEISKRITSKQSGVCLINGPVLRMCDSYDVSDAALDASTKNDAEYMFDNISGSYNFVSITSKNGLLAFGDFSGTCPIYYTIIDGVTCVSNRASALHELRGNSKYNISSLSWLIGHANIFGNESPFECVYSITAGSYLKSPLGSTTVNINKFKNQIWPSNDDAQYLNDLSGDDWDLIVDELVKNFKAASENIPGELRLSLTGGKDSRLVLALALGAGFKDRITTFTNGPEGSPEISCAQNIANKIGVKHVANVKAPQVKAQDFANSWEKLNWHSYRMESYICPWDGATAERTIKNITSDMTGFGGELYRGPGGHAKQFKNLSFMDNKDAILSKFINYHQKMDPLNILSSLYKNAQIGWFYGWLEENIKSVRFDVLPEKFFVENRLSNWNGPLAQNVTGRIKLMPLLSPKVARLVFKLSPEARNKELFHYSVMAKLAPELVSLPFLNATWDKSLQGRFGLDIADAPYDSGVKFTPRSVQAWQAQFVEGQREEIVHLLERAAEYTNIREIFDVDKLCEYVREKEGMNTIEIKTILSSIAVAITLLNDQESVEDLGQV